MSAYAAFVLAPLLPGAAVFLYFRRRTDAHKPPDWSSLLVGNALVLLLFVSMVFLGFETYYRFFCHQTDALADTLVSAAWSRCYVHRNNIGVRDNIDYAYARAAGKRRVTFVGDSFTAGLGVKDVEDRFPNRIRRRHPEWEVHAIAQPGLETSNEVEAVHNLVVSNHYALDLVVLVYNMNDIGEVMPDSIAAYKKLLADPFRNSWLCRNSYFINLYYLRWQVRCTARLQNYFDELEAAYRGSIFEKHKVALTAMCNMTVIRGGRLVVVTFPFMHDPARFKAAHERMNQFWQEHGVPHLDLLPVFSNLPPAGITVNAHDAHPNERAHELAAEKIDVFLREQLRGEK
jgi:lysophospholipase L1-like esterase